MVPDCLEEAKQLEAALKLPPYHSFGVQGERGTVKNYFIYVIYLDGVSDWIDLQTQWYSQTRQAKLDQRQVWCGYWIHVRWKASWPVVPHSNPWYTSWHFGQGIISVENSHYDMWHLEDVDNMWRERWRWRFFAVYNMYSLAESLQ